MHKSKVKLTLSNLAMTLLLPVVIYVVFAMITNGGFGGLMALRTVLRQTIIPAIIAMAISFDMMQGTWDFSAGSIVYASAIIGANLGGSYGTVGIVICCMLVALVLCAISGILYTVLRIRALILSVGMLMVYEALPRLFFKTGGVINLSSTSLAQPPLCFVVFAITFILYYIVYQKSLFGHDVRAIGANQTIANSAGVNITSTKFKTYMVKGALLGVAGFLYIMSNIKVANPDTLTSFGLIFEAMMGTYFAMFLRKYSGMPIGMIVGVFSMKMLTTAMVACGMEATVRSLVTGIFLLLLLCVSSNQARFVDWLHRRELGRQVSKGMRKSLE